MANILPNEYIYDGTGTGEENDPYTPITCEQFMWAVEQEGKYVKLTKNIDFAKDPFYQEGIKTALNISCIKLYADEANDDGSLIGINGLYIQGQSFFYYKNSKNDIDIQKISFRNCIYQKLDDSSAFIRSDGTAHAIKYNNCSISFLIKWGNTMPSFEWSFNNDNSHVSYNHCSEFYTFSGKPSTPSWNTQAQIFTIPRKYCTVQIDYIKLPQIGNGGGYPRHFMNFGGIYAKNTSTNSTFVGNIILTDSPSSSDNNINILYVNNCCFALNIKFDEERDDNGAILYFHGTTGVNILDTSILDSKVKVTIYGSPNVSKLTTEQMKNQDYLVKDVGFLP